MELEVILSLLVFIITSSLQISLFLAFLDRRELFHGEVKKPLLDSALPFVSVIMPVYNEGKEILQALDSAIASDYPGERLEIIVVDDASDENTQKLLGQYKGKITLVRHAKNSGAAEAKNTGIKKAKGEIIVTLDSDTILRKDTLRQLALEMQEYDAIAGAVKIYSPKSLLERLQYVEYNFIIFLRRILHVMDSIHVTPGALSAYRKSAILAVGGFEKMSITEDQEIVFKLQKSGYRVGSTMHAVAYTNPPKTFDSLIKQRVRWLSGGLWNRIKHAELFNFFKYGNFTVYGMFFDIMFFLPMLLFVFLGAKGALDGSQWFSRVGVEDAVFLGTNWWLSGALMISGALIYVFGLYQVNYIEEETGNERRIGHLDYALYFLLYGLLWFIVWPISIYRAFIERKYTWGTR